MNRQHALEPTCFKTRRSAGDRPDTALERGPVLLLGTIAGTGAAMAGALLWAAGLASGPLAAALGALAMLAPLALAAAFPRRPGPVAVAPRDPSPIGAPAALPLPAARPLGRPGPHAPRRRAPSRAHAA